MKLGIYLFVLIISQQFFSFGQLDIINQSLTQPELKLMYAGQKNEITIFKGRKNATYELIVDSEDIKLTKISETQFQLVPSYDIRVATIRLLENGTEIRSDIFSIFKMPIPILKLGTISTVEKSATKERIIENSQFTFEYNGYYKNPHTVVSFELTIYDIDGNITQQIALTEGDRLTEAQLEIIKKLKSGDQLEVNNVSALDNAGIVHRLNGFRLSIE